MIFSFNSLVWETPIGSSVITKYISPASNSSFNSLVWETPIGSHLPLLVLRSNSSTFNSLVWETPIGSSIRVEGED